MKDIWKALIIAFLLFVIPLIWNKITKGGLIHLLGGATIEDLSGMVRYDENLAIHSLDSDIRVITSKAPPQFPLEANDDHQLAAQQWKLRKTK